MKVEPKPAYAIREFRLDDGEAVHALLRQLHIATYVNDELGISMEKVSKRFDSSTPDERRKRLKERMENDDNSRWVAVDIDGVIIGVVAPRIEADGVRRIGALYIDKVWQGKGVAHDLMQKAIEWHGSQNDIELGVVLYNERAKAFYRKWGFEEIPNSETLFDGHIPEVMMIRKGDEHE